MTMEQRVNQHAPVILTLSAPILAVAISGLGWFSYTMATNQAAMAARQMEIKRDISQIEQSLSQFQTKAAARRHYKRFDVRISQNEEVIRKHGNVIDQLDERVDRIEQIGQ